VRIELPVQHVRLASRVEHGIAASAAKSVAGTAALRSGDLGSLPAEELVLPGIWD